MPIYEYECNCCDFRFEEKQGFDDEPVAVCPKCKGIARRVFHPAPIIFKGSGFYITDNRRDGGEDSHTKSEKTAKKPPDKAETKKESV